MSTDSVFNVSQGPVTINGDITHGHVIGVRLSDGERYFDVVVFGACAADTEIAVRRIPGRIMRFGDNRPAVLVALTQVEVL